MIIYTQGNGYAAALDFASKEHVVIAEAEGSDNYSGIIEKFPADKIEGSGATVIDFTGGGKIPGVNQYGSSALGCSINSYSDVNLRIAQEIGLKIPALYKTEPPTPATQIGKSTWLEIKPGAEYSVRGYWGGEKFSMFAITGRWNRSLAGDIGPMVSGAICTAFSILDHENPLSAKFDKLAQYISDKHDSYKGPVYITVIDDGTHLWYKDIYFGFRTPEEYALSRLTDPSHVYFGGNISFGKGYVVAKAVTLYEPDLINVEASLPEEIRLDNVFAANGRVVPTALKIGFVVGKGKTFADAALDADAIAARVCPQFGYRTDAGKRAKEWYYHVRKRIKG